ncbi:MAG: FCD domain-containing protein, partial [Planctomycetota bacterium]
EDASATPSLFKRLLVIEQRFHDALHQAANNRWLMKMLTTTDLLSAVFQRLRRLDPALTPRQALVRSHERHLQLAEWVAAGEGRKARGYNRKLLIETRDREVRAARETEERSGQK